jgi:hypothetical protein
MTIGSLTPMFQFVETLKPMIDLYLPSTSIQRKEILHFMLQNRAFSIIMQEFMTFFKKGFMIVSSLCAILINSLKNLATLWCIPIRGV